LSMHDDESISQAMREAGADAFISKTVGPADLLKAIYAPDRENRLRT
jgi:DNA-binding NarL/FixJ family response regulator